MRDSRVCVHPPRVVGETWAASRPEARFPQSRATKYFRYIGGLPSMEEWTSLRPKNLHCFAMSSDRKAWSGGRKRADNSSCPLPHLVKRRPPPSVSAITLDSESAGHPYRFLTPNSLW